MESVAKEHIIHKSSMNKIFLYVLWGVLVLSPIIILAVESMIFGKNLLMSVPEWSDELEYWREVYSFSYHGFSFGGSYFFGHDAALGPLGAHSVTPLVAWGPFFLLFRSGINIYIILWINILYLVVAWGLFVCLVRPDFKQTAFAILMAYLFPYTILYLHSSMIEIVCLSGMISFFTLFSKWEYEKKDKKNNTIFVLLIFLGIWCTLLRPTYVVILFPVIWAKNHYKINLRLAIYLVIYVVLFGVLYKAYSITSSVYPNGVMYWLSGIDNYHDKAAYIYRNVYQNMHRYFNPISDDLCQFGMRIMNLGLMIYSLAVGIVKEKRHKFEGRPELAVFLVMFGNTVAMILLYDIVDWRDFRSLSPVVFGCLFFMVIREKNKWLTGVQLAIYALAVSLFIISGDNNIEIRKNPEYKDLSSYFAELEQTDEEGNPRTIVFDSTLNWCDISIVSAVPSQMGYQVFWGAGYDEVYSKADYVFLPFGVEPSGGVMEMSIPEYGCIYRMFE